HRRGVRRGYRAAGWRQRLVRAGLGLLNPARCVAGALAPRLPAETLVYDDRGTRPGEGTAPAPPRPPQNGAAHDASVRGLIHLRSVNGPNDQLSSGGRAERIELSRTPVAAAVC